MNKIFAGIVIAIIGVFSMASIGIAQTPTPSNLSITKTTPDSVIDLYGVVRYDIVINNSGETIANGVELYDNLPSNLVDYWQILPGNSFSSGCFIAPSIVSGPILRCTGNINARQSFQNGANIVYVNGIASVTVWGVALRCGVSTNSALFVYNAVLSSQAVSNVQVLCPTTPTPVPTLIPVPTSTPIPPTSTPVIIVVTATPTSTAIPQATAVSTNTPIRIAPLPPRTGSGVAIENTNNLPLYITMGLIVTALIAMSIGAFYSKRE